MGGRDKSGAWEEHTYTTLHKIDNKQECPVPYRDLYWIPGSSVHGDSPL